MDNSGNIVDIYQGVRTCVGFTPHKLPYTMGRNFFFVLCEMPSSEEDIAASDIDSVGSCDSLVREDDEDMTNLPSMDNVYMNSQVGTCLQKVLSDMLEEKQISIQQFISLKRVFNSIHREAFSECQGKLHLSVSGTLDEFSSLPAGSVFRIKDCTVAGASVQVKVPKGTVSLVNSWDS